MPTDDDVNNLLDLDRELTDTERATLMAAGLAAIRDSAAMAAERAHLTYGVAAPEDFADCVLNHLSEVARANLAANNMYTCPDCGRLLKDRGIAE